MTDNEKRRQILLEFCLLPLWPLTVPPAMVVAARGVWRMRRQATPPLPRQLMYGLRPMGRVLAAPFVAPVVALRCKTPKLATSAVLLLALTVGAAVGYGISLIEAVTAHARGTAAAQPAILEGPSGAHLFGTTPTGKDLGREIALGCRNTQLVVSFALLVVMVAGRRLGALRVNRYWSPILSRVFTFIEALPVILGLLIICAIASLWFGKLELTEAARSWLGPITIGLAIGVWLAIPMAQMVGDRIEQFGRKQFIDAALTSGIKLKHIVWYHIIRKNLTSEILLLATHLAALAVLYEVSVGFILSLGSTKLGSHFYSSLAHLVGNEDAQKAVITHNNWWLVTFPMLFIVCTVLGLLLHGDGLHDLHERSAANGADDSTLQL